MKDKKENIVTLKEAIDKLLKVYKISDKMDAISIEKEWAKLMGPTVSKRTKKISLFKGILKVQIESSVLRHELNYSKDRIIMNLNKSVGKRIVREILFY